MHRRVSELAPMISLADLGFTAYSPLPSFNTWSMSLDSYWAGELDEETVLRDFTRFLQEVWAFSAGFRRELPYQLEPDWQEPLKRARDALERVENAAFALSESHLASGWSTMDGERLKNVGARLSRLFECFDELRALESKRPRLSDSAPVHEVLRCADLYAQGQLSQELFLVKLDRLSEHFRGLYEPLEASPLRHPAVDQLLQILEELLDTLDGLRAEVQAGSTSLDPEVLASLDRCAMAAREPQMALEALAGVKTAWCEACGGLVALSNPEASECPLCRHALVDADATPWPEHFRTLLSALESASEQGSQSPQWTAAARELDEALGRLRSVRQELPKVFAVSEDPPDIDIEPALDGFERATSVISDALESGDALRLRSCITDLVQALHEVCEIQREIADWMASQQQTG